MKALAIRTCAKDGSTYGGFKWPLEVGATVTATDWDAKASCGNGLHALLDGNGDYGLLSNDVDAVWQVVEVDREKCVIIDDKKVKFETCKIVYSGNMGGAMTMISDNWIKLALKDIANGDKIQSASGDYSRLAASGYSSQLAASGHYSRLAASGDYSQLAASGDYSQLAASGYSSQLAASGYSSRLAASGHYSRLAASGDYSQLAASGHYSRLAASGHYSRLAASGYSSRLAASGHYSRLAASGDYSQLAASGKKSIAVGVGLNSTASAGEYGCIALSYWDSEKERYRLVVGYVGEKGIKADVVYKLNEKNKLVAV